MIPRFSAGFFNAPDYGEHEHAEELSFMHSGADQPTFMVCSEEHPTYARSGAE